ncbi:MAG: alkaline phosphatase family protein [Acidobacteriaceae bacterium]|nr:alkaline phosphatase family protein [Acidobacteriaceae bacterium]
MLVYRLIALFVCVCVCGSFAAPPKPKLIIGIVIDQFRYDYLTRFRGAYHGGLDLLMSQGADFTNTFYGQVPTVTAVGHSIFMSGAMPAISGIVANAWYDRDENQIVTSVCDWQEKIIGGTQAERGTKCTDSDPASPRRLLVSTLGDELRIAHADSKVIGISIKARGAILPSGHRAAGAYWFDDATGNFVSSTFYMPELPAWASAFNARKLAGEYINKKWEGFPAWNFHAPAGSKTPYAGLPASPWGNELIEQFAEEALKGEKLGQRSATDLLTISFSSNDYVGHRTGPDSQEVRDMAVRTDQLLGRFFRLIDGTIGLKNTLIVLTADHGVASTPRFDETEKMPGGYILADLEEVVQSALRKKFGDANWLISKSSETGLNFDRQAISQLKTSDGSALSKHAIYEVAREAILSTPQLHATRVYSREQLDSGIEGDFIARAEMNGYYSHRSPDLAVVFEPGYMPGTSGTTHFSPYSYDTHVPLLFMGSGIKSGRYDEHVTPNDVAPTLATLLDIQTPSGSSGRVLTEMLLR